MYVMCVKDAFHIYECVMVLPSSSTPTRALSICLLGPSVLEITESEICFENSIGMNNFEKPNVRIEIVKSAQCRANREIFIYIYAYTYTYMYVYVYVYICIYMNMYISLYMYIYMYIYVFVHISIYRYRYRYR